MLRGVFLEGIRHTPALPQLPQFGHGETQGMAVIRVAKWQALVLDGELKPGVPQRATSCSCVASDTVLMSKSFSLI